MGTNIVAPLKEDDVELELGLSLFVGRRSYKEAPVENRGSRLNDVKPGFEPVVLGRLTGESREVSLDAQMEVDARTKREMQALRRQEAKRKREEKRLVKMHRPRNGALSNGVCRNGDVEQNPPKAKLPRGGGLDGGRGVNGWFAGGSMIARPVAGYVSGAGWGSVHDDSEREGSSGKDGSCGSPAVTSSACSDHRRSTSREGGNSSDMKSHISQSGPDQPPSNGSKASDVKSDCECSATSGQVLHSAANGGTDQSEIKTVASNASSPSPNGSSTEAKPDSAPESPQNHVSLSANSVPCRTGQSKRDRGRPPKPQSQSNAASALSSMPCVSTTGDGPNGKTVNGFLYRYSTTEEVNIICVCHGTSFSPAEFVQHAGGTDVSNPLRHITMVASAF